MGLQTFSTLELQGWRNSFGTSLSFSSRLLWICETSFHMTLRSLEHVKKNKAKKKQSSTACWQSSTVEDFSFMAFLLLCFKKKKKNIRFSLSRYTSHQTAAGTNFYYFFLVISVFLFHLFSVFPLTIKVAKDNKETKKEKKGKDLSNQQAKAWKPLKRNC